MAIKEENKINGIQILKEIKQSLFAGDMKLYLENPKDITRKFNKLINEFVEVAGYKTNTQNLIAFLFFFYFPTVQQGGQVILTCIHCNYIFSPTLSSVAT